MSKRISMLVLAIEQSMRLAEKYRDNEELRRFFELNEMILKTIVEKDATLEDLDDLDDLAEIGY